MSGSVIKTVTIRRNDRPPEYQNNISEGKGDYKMAGELLASLMMGEGRVPSQAIIDAYGDDTEKSA